MAASDTAVMTVPAAAFTLTVPADACALAAGDDGVRRMHMLALTGKPIVDHWWWDTLVFELSGIRMLKKKIAALQEHDRGVRLGFWDAMEITKKGLELDGAFLDNDDSARVQSDLDAGFPWQGSIHWRQEMSRIEKVEKGVSTKVNGKSVQGPATVVRETVIDECSWCVSGADSGTAGAGLAAGGDTVEIDVDVLHPNEGRRPLVAKTDELTLDEKREIALGYAPGMTAAEITEHSPAAAKELRVDGVNEAIKVERARAVALAEAAGPADAAEALKAYIAGTPLGDFQGNLAKARGDKITSLQAELATARAGGGTVIPGADPADEGGSPDSPEALVARGGGTGDPEAHFEGLIDSLMEKNSLSRGKAMKLAIKTFPAEHKEFVAAQNA